MSDSASTKKKRIRFCTSFSNVVYDALKWRGWKETSAHHPEWDIMWADREWMREVLDSIHLEPHQKVNHFRNHHQLTRKDMMAKNIKRRKRLLLRQHQKRECELLDFIPLTFTLPHEYSIFVEEFKRSPPNSQWIMKPVAKCQGRGIFIFTKLSEISPWKYSPYHMPLDQQEQNDEAERIENYVVQRYIHQPLLIGRKKFDLRIYVLVTCFAPLTAYIYRSGFARFSGQRYSSSLASLSDTHMHLTNAAVQKTHQEYSKDNDLKWDLRSLKLYLVTQYGENLVNDLFVQIQNSIIQSLICVQSVIINDKHCFELYGYDIMIDRQLKAWLIECNAAPSFSASSDHDYLIKFAVLNDCFDIVMNQKRSDDRLQIGGFDLVYKGGAVEHHNRCLITCYLGCQNPSIKKYKKILDKNAKIKKQKRQK